MKLNVITSECVDINYNGELLYIMIHGDWYTMTESMYYIPVKEEKLITLLHQVYKTYKEEKL